MNRSRNYNSIFIFVIVLLLAVVLLEYGRGLVNSRDTLYSRSSLESDVAAKRVRYVAIMPNAETPTGSVKVSFSDGSDDVVFYSTDVAAIETYLVSNGVNVEVKDVPTENVLINGIIPIIVGLVVMVFVFSMFSGAQNANSGNSRMMNFGKSRAKMSTGEDNKITLNDVAGLKEEKEQLSEIIEFLKDPEKFTKVGARIPKGVLLEGAPGTGKTLLARAVAGEAGVPFFSISGSDFVEMDGFGVNEGIIVMAATNRVDILDPAILRPGRFDRKITVSRPDVGGREEILKVHARNKPLADDVDIKQVAQTTAGFTGADLENLLNESAINAAVDDRQFIKQDDINKAFIQVGIGTEKHSRIISDKEKKITAYHETGHAILFHVLPDVGPVHTISIIPTGLGAAGYTMPLPEKDEMFLTKRKMLQDIMVSLGGRIAEEIIFGDITTGASSDIRKATQEARSMVTKYGMSDSIGVVSYDDNEEDVFIGYDISHSKKHSELVAGEIDKEVKTIIEKCYAKAKEIILQYEDILHASADLLIEKEKIGREEFEALFEGHTITEDVEVTI
ncbi:MAG: AAA family ATPase [Butyrivibrio sp.]|nr:AAA family ATPase [Butyrivibrio sp.]